MQKKTLKKYYNDFSFKHPTPNDIKRTAEKVSGLQLRLVLKRMGRNDTHNRLRNSKVLKVRKLH